MFERERRDKAIFRGVIGVNVLCLASLVFWMGTLVFLNLLTEQRAADGLNLNATSNPTPRSNVAQWKQNDWSELSVILLVLVILVASAIQTTLDLDMLVWRLGPQEEDAARLRRVRCWLTMSTWFLFLAAVTFTCSIFVNPNRMGAGGKRVNRMNPFFMFLFGFGGLILRFVLLYQGHRYWDWLKRGGDNEPVGVGGRRRDRMELMFNDHVL